MDEDDETDVYDATLKPHFFRLGGSASLGGFRIIDSSVQLVWLLYPVKRAC